MISIKFTKNEIFFTRSFIVYSMLEVRFLDEIITVSGVELESFTKIHEILWNNLYLDRKEYTSSIEMDRELWIDLSEIILYAMSLPGFQLNISSYLDVKEDYTSMMCASIREKISSAVT